MGDFILVMDKYRDDTRWIISARKATLIEILALNCYPDPPIENISKALNPADYQQDTPKPLCQDMTIVDSGKVYQLR